MPAATQSPDPPAGTAAAGRSCSVGSCGNSRTRIHGSRPWVPASAVPLSRLPGRASQLVSLSHQRSDYSWPRWYDCGAHRCLRILDGRLALDERIQPRLQQQRGSRDRCHRRCCCRGGVCCCWPAPRPPQCLLSPGPRQQPQTVPWILPPLHALTRVGCHWEGLVIRPLSSRTSTSLPHQRRGRLLLALHANAHQPPPLGGRRVSPWEQPWQQGWEVGWVHARVLHRHARTWDPGAALPGLAVRGEVTRVCAHAA